MRASKARVGPARGAKKKGRPNQRSSVDRGKQKSNSSVAQPSASLTKRRKSRNREDDLLSKDSNNNSKGNKRQSSASQPGLQIHISADPDEGHSASSGSHRRRQFSTSSVRGWTFEASDTVDERLRHPVVRFSLGFALVCPPINRTLCFC